MYVYIYTCLYICVIKYIYMYTICTNFEKSALLYKSVYISTNTFGTNRLCFCVRGSEQICCVLYLEKCIFTLKTIEWDRNVWKQSCFKEFISICYVHIYCLFQCLCFRETQNAREKRQAVFVYEYSRRFQYSARTYSACCNFSQSGRHWKSDRLYSSLMSSMPTGTFICMVTSWRAWKRASSTDWPTWSKCRPAPVCGV